MRSCLVLFSCLLSWVSFAQPSSQPSSAPSGGLLTYDPATPLVSPPEEASPSSPKSMPSLGEPELSAVTFLVPASFSPDVEYYYPPNRKLRLSLLSTGASLAFTGVIVLGGALSTNEDALGVLALVNIGMLTIAPSIGRFAARDGLWGAAYSAARLYPAIFTVGLLVNPEVVRENGLLQASLLGLGGYLVLSAFDMYRTYLKFPGGLKTRPKTSLLLTPLLRPSAYGVGLGGRF